MEENNNDYIPIEHRSPEQLRTSNFAVFMHLVKASTCSGILFLPYAFKKAGWASAILCSLFVGIIYIHTAVVMVHCSQILCKRTRKPALTYAQTAEASFKLGPKPLQAYGYAFSVVVNFIVCFIQYQTSTVYMLYFVTSSKQIIEYYSDWSIDLRLYILFFMPIFIAFGLVPNFTWLVPFSVVGTAFMACGLIVSFGYFVTDMPSPSRLQAYTDPEQVAIFCGIFLFAIYNISILMPLENTMRHPDDIPILFSTGIIIMIVVTLIFGFFGYNKYDEPCDTVMRNLPFEELPAQLVKIAVTIGVLCTFGLQYIVPFTILWPLVREKVGNSVYYELLLRLGGVFFCATICTLLPYLAELLGLFASVSMGTLIMLIPIIIETATKWNQAGPSELIYLIVKNSFIFLMWFIVVFFGARENIRAMIRDQTKEENFGCNRNISYDNGLMQ